MAMVGLMRAISAIIRTRAAALVIRRFSHVPPTGVPVDQVGASSQSETGIAQIASIARSVDNCGMDPDRQPATVCCLVPRRLRVANFSALLNWPHTTKNATAPLD